MSLTMNPHELRFRRTGRILWTLLGLWVGAMTVAAAVGKWAPRSVGDVAYVIFALVVSALFVAMFIVGVMRMVAYFRWTGKYPYYFLFKRSGTSGDTGGKSSGDK
jgi:membrane protein YdbS with pleckstrin-like domain